MNYVLWCVCVCSLFLFAPFRDVDWWEMFYVGFTPHAKILHSYGALRLNAMHCGGPAL